jgi:hypothetical protein
MELYTSTMMLSLIQSSSTNSEVSAISYVMMYEIHYQGGPKKTLTYLAYFEKSLRIWNGEVRICVPMRTAPRRE